MKQNQHQAGGKSSRPVQSKSIRKTAGKARQLKPEAHSRKETQANGAAKPRRVLVKVPMPASLAAAIDEAVRIEGVDRDTLFHRAISAHIVRSRKETQANGATADRRAVITTPDAREMHEAIANIDEANEMVGGLLFLLVGHLEKGCISKVGGIEPSEAEVCGIMNLGHLATGAISASNQEMRDLYNAIGAGDMSQKMRVRSAP